MQPDALCCRFYIGQLVRTQPVGSCRPHGVGVVTEHHCWKSEWPWDVMVEGKVFYYKVHELQRV